MDWIEGFDLFLFDFDGLLVRTEHIHYQAYMNLLKIHGFDPRWDFQKFCSLAHSSAEALKERIYLEFPDLGGNWTALYEEKKSIYTNLISSGAIELMPGAEKLLLALEMRKIRRCVVTNSPLSQVELIRSQNPALKTIPNWVAREHYKQPKPDPECYLLAIERYGQSGDRIIGFEDSAKGFRALSGTAATAVLISPGISKESCRNEGCFIFNSLEDISLP